MRRNKGKYKTVAARKAGRQRGGRAVAGRAGGTPAAGEAPPRGGKPSRGSGLRLDLLVPPERNLWFYHGSQWKIWFALQKV